MSAEPKKLSVGFLYDDTLDSADGVAQYVKTLGAWLSSQGHSVCYLVGQTKLTDWQGGKIYSLAKNFSVRFNANRLSTPGLAASAGVKKALAQEQLDVLHVQMPYSPFMAGRVLRRAGSRTAVVGTFHIYPAGFLPRIGTKLLSFLLHAGLKRFNLVLSVSTAAEAFARRYFGVKSLVLPNTVDIKRFKPAVPVKQAKGRIVFIGRLVGRKGARQLIQAYSVLEGKLPGTSLVIAGAGPQMEELKQKAKQLGLNGKVEFLGFVSEEQKAKLLASASIACFPATGGESFGIVLIEAMAAGSGVVIGGDNPGYRSVLGKHEELLFDPDDTNNFAARLERLLTDKDLSAKLHEWQEAEVKKYDVNVVGPQMVNYYMQAIAMRVKTGHNKN